MYKACVLKHLSDVICKDIVIQLSYLLGTQQEIIKLIPLQSLFNDGPFGNFQCMFEDVIAEPDGTHSIDCVFKLSHTCFTCWKGLCYKLSTLLCGICIAARWGCEFASLSFIHIWLWSPMYKIMQLNCGFCRKIYALCVDCCMEPCCMACGMLFHQFKKSQKNVLI